MDLGQKFKQAFKIPIIHGYGLSEQQVLNACRGHLPYAKSPKVVIFGGDVPLTSTGKYQRSQCRDLFGEWRTTQLKETE